MYNHYKKDFSLHIDTYPLGINFFNDIKNHKNVSPFPSPTSSSSSITTASTHQSRSFQPISRNKCQLHRQNHSLQSPNKITAKSWESIKSPAASFLASFALSPVLNDQPLEDEQEGDEIDDYTLDKLIGYGGFATVRKGFRNTDGEKIAIKIIKNNHKTTDDRLEREISIWKQLNHPNVVQLEKVLETDYATFLICEYCDGGSLLDALHKPMTEDRARLLFRQLCEGVHYLHEEAKVCHKDLKLENILLDAHNTIKICDFGLSIHQQPHYLSSSKSMDDLDCAGGSLAYVAPEQIKSSQSIPSPSTDIWSLGVILYAMVASKLPFSDDYDLRLQQKVIEGKYTVPTHLSSGVIDLIQHCLTLQPEERYDINQVLRHPWLN
ncbi:kinase-like domain-containing protein [Pilobolus umbonatus]|nr:kinase-like domain-containing protein [Pilobolus umbonatus]